MQTNKNLYLDLAKSAGLGGALTTIISLILLSKEFSVVEAFSTSSIIGGLFGYISYHFSEVAKATPQAIKEAVPKWCAASQKFRSDFSEVLNAILLFFKRPSFAFAPLVGTGTFLVTVVVLILWLESIIILASGLILVSALFSLLYLLALIEITEAIVRLTLSQDEIYKKWYNKVQAPFVVWWNTELDFGEYKETRGAALKDKTREYQLMQFLVGGYIDFSWQEYASMQKDMITAILTVWLSKKIKEFERKTICVLAFVFVEMPVGIKKITCTLFRMIHSGERAISACYSVSGGLSGALIALQRFDNLSILTVINAGIIGAVLSASMACLAYRLITTKIKNHANGHA
ncbi:MAG: hypothetical protein WCV58_04235 [Patescibacteria group bacterium]|jgi:hypothetical protein